jgi:HlyD family secretion protein
MNYDSRINADGYADENPLLAGDEDDRRSRLRLWVVGIVVLLAMVAIWMWINRAGVTAADEADKKDQAPVVSVISPGRATIEGAINATGTLAARRELPIGVAGEGGQVAAVLVEPGQWVNAGQVLVVIDRSVQVQQQNSQAAQIEVARANSRLAQDNLDRALRLVERGFISKAEIDRLTAARDAAQAQVRVAGAQLGVLQAQTRRLNIVAPAAGLVLERRVEPGQVVGGGSGILIRMAKGGEMELEAQLGQVELTQVGVGVSAMVTPVGSERTFVGQVWQMPQVIDPASRQGLVRIALAYSPELVPGGFASVVIRAGSVEAPMLPESAILSDTQGAFVYIVGKDNKVERRAVKTGTVTANGIAVIEGLTGTEKVVMRAGGFLSPGETIQPKLVKR